jgi:hypothetical protein
MFFEFLLPHHSRDFIFNIISITLIILTKPNLLYEIEHDENVIHWDVPMAIGTEMRDSIWPKEKL